MGDPHVTTIDSYKYTFNGLGEYYMCIASTPSVNKAFTLQGNYPTFISVLYIPTNFSIV